MHHILDGALSQSPDLAQRACSNVWRFATQVVQIDTGQIEALLGGQLGGSGRVEVGDLPVEVGDLVGLDRYPGIDRGGTTGDREIAGIAGLAERSRRLSVLTGDQMIEPVVVEFAESRLLLHVQGGALASLAAPPIVQAAGRAFIGCDELQGFLVERWRRAVG